MIELKDDRLRFSFPEVHPSAKLSIEFERTLRIPDDEKDYSLPPGLGQFPLKHVDDFANKVPTKWVEHGGVMLPMYQAEAMWIRFSGSFDRDRFTWYPLAVGISVGKINAVTGKQWAKGLHKAPQDYIVAPRQPWLDGFCVKKGVVRQFVAMPLGQGYTAEEQITGEAEHGGIQIVVYPMKREVFERRFPKYTLEEREQKSRSRPLISFSGPRSSSPEMGLAAGGRMKQEIYNDPYDIEDWDTTNVSRCFVHIANSQMWRAITGEVPPTVPPTAKSYTEAGLPWFDYYGEGKPLKGSALLKGLKSVSTMGKEKGEQPLPENESVRGEMVVPLRNGLAKDQVREGTF